MASYARLGSKQKEIESMKRTPVNPWEWSKQYQFNQAEITELSEARLR